MRDFFLQLDASIHEKMSHLNPILRKFLLIFSLNPKFLYLPLLLVNYLYFDSKFSINIIFCIVMDVGVRILKNIIKRQRPTYEKQNLFGMISGLGTDAYSFPSSHTFTAFQLILLLVLMFGPVRYFSLIYAALVGISRLALKHHHFSDVFFAAIFALIVSIINVNFL